MTKQLTHRLLLLTLLTFALGGCSGNNTSDNGGNGATSENEAPQSPANSAVPPGSVVNKIEKSGALSYKIYLQPESNGATRKGIVLLGSGNDENDPTTGGLDGDLENNLANELAKLGYVAAIVAYRDEPPLVPKDDGASWNSNTAMLATDMSQVADTIVATYGGGLNRSRVVTGGVSYTSYALLTNIAMNDTPLADTRGVLATCGATGDYEAKNFKRPIFSLNCSGNSEGDFNGLALIDKITDAKVKADSGYFTDGSCSSHCGGTTPAWTSKLVERVQLWLP